MLPSAVSTASAPRSKPISRLHSPACTCPCPTLRMHPRGRRRMARGHRGSLGLRCRALSSPPSCRFIPAHRNFGLSRHLRSGRCPPRLPRCESSVGPNRQSNRAFLVRNQTFLTVWQLLCARPDLLSHRDRLEPYHLLVVPRARARAPVSRGAALGARCGGLLLALRSLPRPASQDPPVTASRRPLSF